MADHVGLGRAHRQRRGAPVLARLLVADVERLARAIRDRIVVPRGDAVLVAVESPRTSDARLRHRAAEIWIRQHVDPRRGRGLVARQHDHVLAGHGVEAAQPVVEAQFRPLERGLGVRARACASPRKPPCSGRPLPAPVELQLDRAAVSVERGACNREQQVVDVGVHLVDAAQEHAAGLVEHLQRMARPHEDPQPVVELVSVAGGPRVEDNEVGGKPLVPPVLVGEERLAYERRVLQLLDSHQQDRQVARDADRPQARQRQPVLDRRLDLERRVGLRQQQSRREALERDGLVRADAQVAQLELGGGPREVDRTLGSCARRGTSRSDAALAPGCPQHRSRRRAARSPPGAPRRCGEWRSTGRARRPTVPVSSPPRSTAMRAVGAAEPAEERGAVGLVRPVARHLVARHEVQPPYALLGGASRPSCEQQGVGVRERPRSRRTGWRRTCALGRRLAR